MTAGFTTPFSQCGTVLMNSYGPCVTSPVMCASVNRGYSAVAMHGLPSRNIKRRPLLRYGVSGCNTTLTEKERLYESREVYRYGHSSGHHFRCRNGCERQADHGMPAGN